MATLLDIVQKGAVNRAATIRIIDSTTGQPEIGVVWNTAGIDLWYRREGAVLVSITEAVLAALTTAHTDGGFLHISDGEYRLDLPDAACASGANHVDVGGTVTGMVVIGGRIRLVDYDPEDAVRLGLTPLPAAAPDAAGGMPISDAGALDMDTQLSDANTLLLVKQALREQLGIATGETEAGSTNYTVKLSTLSPAVGTLDAFRGGTLLIPDGTNALYCPREVVRFEDMGSGHWEVDVLPPFDDAPESPLSVLLLPWAVGARAAKTTFSTKVDAVTTQTEFTLVDGPPDNDAVTNQSITLRDLATPEQSSTRSIAAYVGASKTVTLDAACDFTIAAGDYVSIEPMRGTNAAATAVSVDRNMDLAQHLRGFHTHQGDTYYVAPTTGNDTTGDGSRTLPYATLQNAIIDLITDSNHDTVIFLADDPSDTTTHSTATPIICNKRHFSILGPGRDAIVTRSNNGNTFEITADGVEISGFQIGTAGTGSGDGVNVTDADFHRIRNCWFLDTRGDGIHVLRGENIQIHDNHFDGTGVAASGQGVHIVGTAGSSNDNMICGNHFARTGGDSILIEDGTTNDTEVHHNTIHNAVGWAINIGASSNDAQVHHNTLGNNASGNITDVGTGSLIQNNYDVAEQIQKRPTWYLDQRNGSDSNTGKSSSDAFETTAKVLSEASSGDLVLLAKGTYPGQVSLLGASLTGITMEGTTRNEVIIENSTNDEDGVILHSGTTLRRMTITATGDNSQGISSSGPGNLVVEDVSATGVFDGAAITAGEDLIIRDSTFNGNFDGLNISGMENYLLENVDGFTDGTQGSGDADLARGLVIQVSGGNTPYGTIRGGRFAAERTNSFAGGRTAGFFTDGGEHTIEGGAKFVATSTNAGHGGNITGIFASDGNVNVGQAQIRTENAAAGDNGFDFDNTGGGNIVVDGATDYDVNKVTGTLTNATADSVHNALLTGAMYNIATSHGRRIREIFGLSGGVDGAIWFNSVTGQAGTGDDNGIATNPSDNMADTMTMLLARGYTRIRVASGSTVTLGAALEGVTMFNSNWTLVLNGQSVSNSHFIGATDVSGICTGAVPPRFTNCHFNATTLPPSHLCECGWIGTITAGSAGEFNFARCHSEGDANFDFGSGLNSSVARFSHYSGDIEIQNMGAGSGSYTMRLGGEGHLTINANCSATSTVTISGAFTRTDNSGGAVTFVDDARYDVTQVNAEVVDALATDTYATPGQGTPAATLSLAAKIGYMFKNWRNRKTQDATTWELYADDGITVDQKAAVSDDGTDAVKGEIVTGP